MDENEDKGGVIKTAADDGFVTLMRTVNWPHSHYKQTWHNE